MNYVDNKITIQTFLARLKYSLTNGSGKIIFQEDRIVDTQRELRYTNRFTVSDLFPDEDKVSALKRELSLLGIENYIESVKDSKFVNRSDMRVFGKNYQGADVYIKIRVELLSARTAGCDMIFIMSFHYAEKPFCAKDFPYLT